VIELLPTVERQATRIMAGIEPGWEPSHGITRESRKNEMGLVLSRSGKDETADGLTSRRVEQIELAELGPAVTRLLFRPREHREPSLRDRAIFAQFINPEFLA